MDPQDPLEICEIQRYQLDLDYIWMDRSLEQRRFQCRSRAPGLYEVKLFGDMLGYPGGQSLPGCGCGTN